MSHPCAAPQWEGKLAAALDGLGGQLPAAAASQARFVRSTLGLPRGANAVVTNGRVVELPGEGEEGQGPGAGEDGDLEPADFELLELFAQQNQYSRQVAQLVRQAVQVRGAGGRDLVAGRLGPPSARLLGSREAVGRG